MPQDAIDAFRRSLKRCLATPEFLHDFYELFMASDDAIRRKFAKTEFPRQTRVLADSLYIMAMAAESKADAYAWKELDRLAERHARAGLDVSPRFYDSWLDCLIVAARAHDAEFTDDVERAWRSSLQPGIEHLRSRY